MPQQGPKTSTVPASRPDFNTTRYAALARQLADNAMAAKPNQAIIEQIILTRQIERKHPLLVVVTGSHSRPTMAL